MFWLNWPSLGVQVVVMKETQQDANNKNKKKRNLLLTVMLFHFSYVVALDSRLYGLCGDNCNTSFDEAARTGMNEVFTKPTTSNLKMNIRGIRCTVNILHSDFQTSADICQLTLRPRSIK
jgi:hypothetical protein